MEVQKENQGGNILLYVWEDLLQMIALFPENISKRTLSVILPFFQREEGLLTRAVQSILDQDIEAVIRIIVVDDASPLQAERDLCSICDSRQANIEIIRRENGGPAAARNTGLAHIKPDTDYVAFLDPDDIWFPNHLSTAIAALDQGYDFFFSNFYQPGQEITAFERGRAIDPAQHPVIPMFETIHRYQGSMTDQIVSGNVIGTSTVVFRYAVLKDVRFRETFRYAGEDYLFWLDSMQLTDKIAFSVAPTCRCGFGVNVFGSAGWGTEKSLHQICYMLRYRLMAQREFPLSPKAREENRRRIWKTREAIIMDLLHRLLHRRGVDWRLLRSYLVTDPICIAYALPLTGKLIFDKLVRRPGANP